MRQDSKADVEPILSIRMEMASATTAANMATGRDGDREIVAVLVISIVMVMARDLAAVVVPVMVMALVAIILTSNTAPYPKIKDLTALLFCGGAFFNPGLI